MATVYLATQERLKRQVALKIISPQFAPDATLRDRFVAEGQLTARLLHRHILTVFDIGEFEGGLYLATEFLAGGSLLDKLHSATKPSLAERLRVVRQVAEGLGYAHQSSVVHRDIKPANVLFRGDGSPVLADFGIAKALDITGTPTLQGVMIGTPSYMSPEQAQGRAIDQRSDLYSLGVMLYELLAGRLPFEASDPISMALAHVVRPPEPLPAEVARFQPLVSELLEKVPEKRLRSADVLIERLAALESSTGQPPVVNTAPVTPLQRRMPHRGVVAALAVLVLFAAAAGGWWMLRGAEVAVPLADASGSRAAAGGPPDAQGAWASLGAQVKERIASKLYFAPKGGSAHDALRLMLAERPSDSATLGLLREFCEAVAKDIATLLEAGSRTQAAYLLGEATTHFPNYKQFAELRARFVAPEAQAAEAAVVPKRVEGTVDELRTRAAALASRGVYQDEDGPGAVTLFKAVLDRVPDDAGARAGLQKIGADYAGVARLWMDRGRPDQAFVIAERGLGADGDNQALAKLREEARAALSKDR